MNELLNDSIRYRGLSSSRRRIPSLDGLRAVSIGMVVMLHSLQQVSTVHHVPKYWFLLGNGNTGVYVFFVISGFLITSLLLREWDVRRTISLGQFYLRRAFRILPAAYCYVAMVALLAWGGALHLTRVNALAAALFCSNYTHQAWPLEHFWSLAVEEQFYLLWPLTLVVCLRRGGQRMAAKLAGMIILLCPIVRVVSSVYGSPYVHAVNGSSFQGRADCLMFGCSLALLCGSETFEFFYAAASRYIWVFAVLLIVVSGSLEIRFANYWAFPLGITLNGVCIAMLLIWCVRSEDSWVGRLLNSRPMVWIGTLSYSIYIWQQVLLNPHSSVLRGVPSLLRLAGLYTILLVVSSTSHYLLEQPFLRLRQGLEKRRHASVGRAEEAV